jgi:peptidoglycan/xylan/chitin deacetylase (PgdA/CDA1 family)
VRQFRHGRLVLIAQQVAEAVFLLGENASMNRSQQYPITPASGEFSAPAALRRVSGLVATSYGELTGKLTRFLARNVPTKKLAMRNAVPLVSFTFDDAAATACTAGAALLEQYQARGTFYISGGNCGATTSPTGPLATTDQIQALHRKGHEIACHTYSHIRVARLSEAALASDLERNRRFLQGVLGNVELRNFAYPFGDISFKAKRYLGERYDSCRSHTPGVNFGVADLGALRSCALERASIDRRGIERILAETVRRNGWLIFAGHDIDNAPSQYGVAPDLLAFALQSALAARCRLVTVSQALRILAGAAPDRAEAATLTQ